MTDPQTDEDATYEAFFAPRQVQLSDTDLQTYFAFYPDEKPRETTTEETRQ